MQLRPDFRCILTAILLLGIAPARAEDGPLDGRAIVRGNGLEGTWSKDCSKPPSPFNRRVRWVVPASGPVQQWVDFGEGYEFVASVLSAVAGTGRVTLSVNTESGWSWVGTSVRVGDKLRELDIVNTYHGRSVPTIRDGRDLSTDRETPLIEKCDEDPANS